MHVNISEKKALAWQSNKLILPLVGSLAIHSTLLLDFHFSPQIASGAATNSRLLVTLSKTAIDSGGTIGFQKDYKSEIKNEALTHEKTSRSSLPKLFFPTKNILPPEIPVTPPKLLTPPPPPDDTIFISEKGYANIEMEIGFDGKVLNATTTSSDLPEEFQKLIELRTLEAIFEPATQGGKSIPGRTNLRFEFRPAEPLILRYEWIPDFQPSSG